MSNPFADFQALDQKWHATIDSLGLEHPKPCALCAAVEDQATLAAQTCPDCPAPRSDHPWGCLPGTQTLPGGSVRAIRQPKFRPEAEARQSAMDRRHGLRYDLCGLCGGLGWLRADRPSPSHPEFGHAVRCSCPWSSDQWYAVPPEGQSPEMQEASPHREPPAVAARAFPPSWRTKSLSSFDEMPENAKAVAAVRDWTLGPDSTFLVLGGECGVGKTHLAAAAANALRLERWDVEVWPWTDLAQTVMRAFTGGTDEAQGVLAAARLRCHRAPVLVVDDLRCTENSEALIAEWEALVDARYAAGLPMLVTTNVESKDLKFWSPRAFSRLRDLSRSKWVLVKGPDHRAERPVP